MKAIICVLEALPGVFDMEKALDPDAPQIGPDRTDGKHPNYIGHYPVYKGNPKEKFQDCDVVIEQKYETVMQEHAYLETEGGFAIPTPEANPCPSGPVVVSTPGVNPYSG